VPKIKQILLINLITKCYSALTKQHTHVSLDEHTQIFMRWRQFVVNIGGPEGRGAVGAENETPQALSGVGNESYPLSQND